MSQQIIVIDLEEFKGILKNLLLECNAGSPIHPSLNTLTEKWISRKEAAQFLGVSLPTLGELVKKNVLPAYRMGSKIVFKKSEITSSLKPVQTQKFKRS
jgi:excisionase family DNA binding protein